MKISQNNKKESMKRNSLIKIKLAYIVIVMVLALVLLMLRFFFIQSNNADKYNEKILSQQRYDSREIPFKRGDIRDRNGNILAVSNKVYNLILDPVQMNADKDAYLEPTVSLLVEIFGYNEEDLRNIIEEKKNSAYIIFDKNISYDKKNEFTTRAKEYDKESLNLRSKNRIHGVWFEEDYIRSYPNGILASEVLGFSNSEGNLGTGGIEQYYNSELMGTLGREYGYLNEESNLERVIKQAINGNTIVSTIDLNIQKIVEKYIEQWENVAKSKITAVLVMNPRNGEILAMATSRKFDPNNPRDLSYYYDEATINAMDEEAKMVAYNTIWRNYLVNDTYEPGSPSKVFTVAAGIEEGATNKNASFYCDGGQHIGRWHIRCANRNGHGNISLAESLMLSCNDAMMQIVASLGKDKFVDYMDRFGFGKKTGIDLPGEADTSTLVYRKENMGATDLATNSFGQNYNTTMIQTAAALSSAINGGYYYEPHVVKEILNSEGMLIESKEAKLVKQTVSTETSRFLNEALRLTVEEGTGVAAKVEGYNVGGKTGTAEKLPRGSGNYVVSFIGFAPTDNPRVLCYVLIDEPGVEEQARSSYASAIFSKIMGEVLPYMGIFPSLDIKLENNEEEGINVSIDKNKVEEENSSVENESPVAYETDEYLDGELSVDLSSENSSETESVQESTSVGID